MQYSLLVCAAFVLIAIGGSLCAEETPKVDAEPQITEQQLPLEPHAEAGPKTKRGIFHYNRSAHSHHVPVHGLTYNVPLGTAAYPHYGFQKPWQQPFGFRSVPQLPPHHHHHVHHVAATAPTFFAAAAAPTAIVHHHHQPLPVVPVAQPTLLTGTAHFVPPPPPPPAPIHPQFVLSPGGAAVTSYNVNYPRYPYYGRPTNVDVPVVAVGGIRPPPNVFVKPAAGGLVPTYANRIPVGRPVFTAGAVGFPHTHQYVPTAGGVYPIAAAGGHSHHHFVPAATVPTFAAAAPLAPVQPTLTVIPTAATTTPTAFDQWRPIYVAQPAFASVAPSAGEAQPNPHAGQPSISLLPPFGSAPAGVGAASTLDEQTLFQQQLELQHQQQQQQQYESAAAAAAEYTAEQHQQQYQQSQVYGPPSDNSLDAGQEYVQASQQLQQQQQQRAIIEEQQQIHSSGAFNGQAYETASNNGHYAGPSSYEVQLNSYTRAV